ncbi:MAG: helix-turn-helix domain-containing protein [Promethearchaeota archaeon]
MIKDIIIIKDGLPLYSKHFNEVNMGISEVFTENNDIIMMAGFFSALNSFSEEFDNFGPIRELKLLNTELKLSFLKDSEVSNLIYLATFDDKSKGPNVQRVLRKISRTFVESYGEETIENWSGKSDSFIAINDKVDKFVKEEEKETEKVFRDKVGDLFKDVEEKLYETARQSNKNDDTFSESDFKNQKFANYYEFVPFLKSSRKIDPQYYLTGETSQKIFKQINGQKSIDQIARELQINQEQVYNVCKNLIKIGFVSLDMD